MAAIIGKINLALEQQTQQDITLFSLQLINTRHTRPSQFIVLLRQMLTAMSPWLLREIK